MLNKTVIYYPLDKCQTIMNNLISRNKDIIYLNNYFNEEEIKTVNRYLSLINKVDAYPFVKTLDNKTRSLNNFIDKNKLTKLIKIDNRTFRCDRGLVNLIITLNKLGYVTEFCCDGHYGYTRAYILIKGYYNTFDLEQTDDVLITKTVYHENYPQYYKEKNVPYWLFESNSLENIYKYFNKILSTNLSPFDLIE